MLFDLTTEQEQLRDSLQKWLRADYGFERRREIASTPEGWSGEVWQQLADLGVLALTLPEAHGGLGGGPMDTLLVMEEIGRSLVLEPYLSTVVLGAALVARAGSDAQRAATLGSVADGSRRLAFAHYEPGQRYAPRVLATRAERGGEGWRLNGTKTNVIHGGTADQWIVSAHTGTGASLFLVDRRAAGVEVLVYPTHDEGRAARIVFADVRLPADALLGREGTADPVIEHAIDGAIAAVCAEAVGAMSALLEMTGEYLRTRRQFGVPIGSFQVLQHRMADMLLDTERARSMALLAATQLETAAPAERRRIVSAAKVKTSEAARFVGQQAVQLHGGIGVTDELAVSHYFKRLALIERAFGDADFHLGEVARHLYV
jgi:alkylation response protein AidB-like acyl-CoA dehydrogenase